MPQDYKRFVEIALKIQVDMRGKARRLRATANALEQAHDEGMADGVAEQMREDAPRPEANLFDVQEYCKLHYCTLLPNEEYNELKAEAITGRAVKNKPRPAISQARGVQAFCMANGLVCVQGSVYEELVAAWESKDNADHK